jgi:hypothetical protein
MPLFLLSSLSGSSSSSINIKNSSVTVVQGTYYYCPNLDKISCEEKFDCELCSDGNSCIHTGTQSCPTTLPPKPCEELDYEQCFTPRKRMWNRYRKNCVDKDDCPAYNAYNCRHWSDTCQFCPKDNSCVQFDLSHQEFGCPTPSPTPAPTQCCVCEGSY